MDRRAYLRVAGAAGLGTLAGCFGVGADPGDGYDVGMSVRDFQPEAIGVGVGETVVWRNTSSSSHTVTAYEGGIPDDAEYWASGGFESEQAARDAWTNATGGALAQGAEYERTFEVPGEHQYVCLPHEPQGMVGTVVVSE